MPARMSSPTPPMPPRRSHRSKSAIEVPASRQLHLPREAVERLEALDRVALHRRAEALADDLVEVDEPVAAEQLVHLLLARVVAAHEPAQVRRLVGRVVVDVEVRVRVRGIRGSGRWSARTPAAPRPRSRRHRRPGSRRHGRAAAQPRRGCPVRAARRGSRYRPRPRRGHPRDRGRGRPGSAPGRARRPLVVSRLPSRVRAGSSSSWSMRRSSSPCDLDAGLLPDAQQGLRAGVLQSRCSAGSSRTARARRVADAPLHELRAGPRGDAGHEREVVIAPSASAADDVPAADAAVLGGLRVGRRRGRVQRGRRPGRCGQEGRLDHAMVGTEVRGPERLRLAVPAAEGHVHALPGRRPGWPRAARCRRRSGGSPKP